jgi:hypothetical protein
VRNKACLEDLEMFDLDGILKERTLLKNMLDDIRHNAVEREEE